MNCYEASQVAPERIVVIDIETTGLSADEGDEVLSMAVVNGKGDVMFHDLFGTEHKRRWSAAEKINGISPSMVKGRPSFAQRLDEIEEVLSEAEVLVGYNLKGFDLPFLLCSGLRIGSKVSICDVMLEFSTYRKTPDTRRRGYKWYKLKDCASYFGHHIKGHDSLEDAKATLVSFRRLAEIQKHGWGCLMTLIGFFAIN